MWAGFNIRILLCDWAPSVDRHTAPATCVRASSQEVGVSCPEAFFTMGRVRRWRFSPSYANLRTDREPGVRQAEPADRGKMHSGSIARLAADNRSSHRVLSEIHSSLTSSLRRGMTLMTSPPLVLTTMLLPTASSTSMDSVFLRIRHQRSTETNAHYWPNKAL